MGVVAGDAERRSQCVPTRSVGTRIPFPSFIPHPSSLILRLVSSDGLVPHQAAMVVGLADASAGWRNCRAAAARRRSIPASSRPRDSPAPGGRDRANGSGRPPSAASAAIWMNAADAGKHVVGLELGQIGRVAPRHAVRAHHELREEREIEADEQQQAARAGRASRCTSAR